MITPSFSRQNLSAAIFSAMIGFAAMPLFVKAQDSNISSENSISQLRYVQETAPILLSEIVVYGERNKSLTSAQTIDNDDMQIMPVGNGNISDYVKSNVHVRYEKSDSNGVQRGEIMPEWLSINGADANQTAYFVDNVNVNNELTVSDIFDGAMQVLPNISHTQGYFFDADMLSAIEVQDSNISASLGGFMGGALIAKTKQYSGEDRFKFHYRTTASDWAALNAGKYAGDVFARVRPESNGIAALQPEYRKQDMNVIIEKGIRDNMGMVFAASRRHSHIAQNRLIGLMPDTQLVKENHKRQSDNALLNLNWQINDNNRLELSWRYSNYFENKYFADNIDGNAKDYHQAYGATFAWVHEAESGTWTNTLAYDVFTDKRQSNAHKAEIISVLDENTFDPLYNYEKGGYGDSRLKQHNLHFSTEYAFQPFFIGDSEHSVSVGGIYQKTDYDFYRPQAVDAAVKTYLSDGSLLFSDALHTPAGRAKTDYQNAALYAEDLISWKNFEFRAGLRAERDDYLKNTNIAPRLVLRYQPNAQSQWTIGANRYYGRSFAALKLTEDILKIHQDASRQYKDGGRLKTPYADEFSLGYEQKISNLNVKLGYIYRQNNDRIIMKKDDKDFNYYTNGRDFSNRIYTVEIENKEPWQIGNTYWKTTLGLDWLDSSRADVGNPNQQVYLDGKLMSRADMVRKVNSSREDWQLHLGLNMYMPDSGIDWSNDVYIKAPIKGYEDIDDPLMGIDRYRSYDYGSHVQWDSALRWQSDIYNHRFYIQGNVLNVLNHVRKTHYPISSRDNAYTAGREFWLKFAYEF